MQRRNIGQGLEDGGILKVPDMIRLNAIFEKRAGIIEGSFLTRLQLLALTTSNQIGAGHDLINYYVSK
ncbi:MAG: hypothetical protein II336_20190 [Loktanella sp.]|nr:hypothetical protein [Loktanella sp.]